MLNQLVRYEPVLRLIRELSGGTLLDVGSRSVGARGWLGAEWNITAVDAAFQDYGTATGPAAHGAHRVVGDVRGLEFPASRFDVVLALDLLEHIDKDDRPQALGALARVARQRLIVACPRASRRSTSIAGLRACTRRAAGSSLAGFPTTSPTAFPSRESSWSPPGSMAAFACSATRTSMLTTG